MPLTPITVFFHAVFLEGATPGFFGGLSFFLSEKLLKGTSFTSGQISRPAVKWLSWGSLRTNICSALFWPDPKQGRKIYQEIDLLEHSEGFERPHRNEALGICQGSPGLQDVKPAPPPWELSELSAQGTEHSSSCSNYTTTLASKGPPREAVEHMPEDEMLLQQGRSELEQGKRGDPCSEAAY